MVKKYGWFIFMLKVIAVKKLNTVYIEIWATFLIGIMSNSHKIALGSLLYTLSLRSIDSAPACAENWNITISQMIVSDTKI